MADILMQQRAAGTESMFELDRRSAAMAHVRHRNAGADDGSGQPAVPGAIGWLPLAAAPTFAIMALASFISAGNQAAIICSAMPDMSPLTGMVAMYALMSIFHLTPWVKLVSDRRARAFQDRKLCGLDGTA